MDITGIGAVSDLIGTVVNKIWPDKTEAEKQQLAAAMMVVQGQIDINKVEAASPSAFTSGWRPFIGWVCGMACAWNWIGLKLALFIAAYYGHPMDLSPADVSEMMPVLMGMLGLGTLRTFERVKGVIPQGS
ncbi:3TM-type holin [Propionivibrio sp.]|uniref:3TM-type holin n=1 Tax=Propionivibrio sp. TaxID=2212460 RepID=UPI003BEFDE0B